MPVKHPGTGHGFVHLQVRNNKAQGMQALLDEKATPSQPNSWIVQISLMQDPAAPGNGGNDVIVEVWTDQPQASAGAENAMAGLANALGNLPAGGPAFFAIVDHWTCFSDY